MLRVQVKTGYYSWQNWMSSAWKLMKMQSCTKKEQKKWHDKRIQQCEFHEGEKVLIYNSRLHLFPGKLRSRWYGPFTVAKVFPYGTLELAKGDGSTFKINGHRVKHYEEDLLQERRITTLRDS